VVFVHEPLQAYLMLDGYGDPTGPAFRHAVEALLAVARGCHHALTPPATAPQPPLLRTEALLGDDGAPTVRPAHEPQAWTAMIVQPDALTPDLVERIRRRVNVPLAGEVRFERFAEGPAVELLHRGLLRDVDDDLARLQTFIDEHELVARGRLHEIFLTDAHHGIPDRARTLLRRPVGGRRPVTMPARSPFPRFEGRRA
jgi:hypothetical protein